MQVINYSRAPDRTCKYAKFLAFVLGISTLTACKVEIVVPSNGSVTTLSGAYACSAGKICEIQVLDLFFYETFIAEPAAGYKFSHWVKNSGGLCGGDAGPCRLHTSNFSDSPALMFLLESDEIVYLTPVFEIANVRKNTDTWYNCMFAQTGMIEWQTFSTRYRTTTGETRLSGVVEHGITYAGKIVDRVTSSGEETGENLHIFGAVAYRQYDKEERLSRLLAINSETFSSGAPQTAPKYDPTIESETSDSGTPSTTTKIKYEPGLEVSQDIPINQTDTRIFIRTTKTTQSGQTSTRTTWGEVSTTYLGEEEITVEAGTYSACKTSSSVRLFDGPVLQPAPQDSTPFRWTMKGYGIPVDGVKELLSATVNGKEL